MNIRKCGFAILVALLAYSSSGYAQKNDYVWLSGYMGNNTGFVGFSSHFGFYFGTSKIDFNYTPRHVSFDSLIRMNFDKTNTSFCDSDGNLMFYTNGIYIANSLDEKIENSDSLNAGYVQYVWAPLMQNYGYRNPQGIICIPSLINKNQYYFLHSWIDSSSSNNLIVKKILLTTLDVSLNSSHGKVVSKNQTIISDSLGEELVAIRHGNGKDWWLLVQKRNSNCYYRILVDSSGVHTLPDLTCGGGGGTARLYRCSLFFTRWFKVCLL